MSKTKSIFFCQNCGFESPKWMGKCNSCGAWNSFIEEKVVSGKKKQPSVSFGTASDPEPIRQIKLSENTRISTGNHELNRVLGGGIVPGSLILIGGEPGIGKSTLMLQVALRSSLKFLYVSGEESPRQIRLRAERIGILNESCYVFGETQLEKILGECEKLNPDVLIIDSIQTAHTDRIDSS
ncbi:MAG: ATPase domain-containing protein, partial [Bacteroidota bacterium]